MIVSRSSRSSGIVLAYALDLDSGRPTDPGGTDGLPPLVARAALVMLPRVCMRI